MQSTEKANCDHSRARGENRCRWCSTDMGPLDDRLPRFERRARRPKLLGAYRVWLAYGGPQEGGWWVQQYEHLASVIVRKGDRLPKLARTLWDLHAEHDDGRRVSDSDADCAVYILCEDIRPGQHEHLGVGHYS